MGHIYLEKPAIPIPSDAYINKTDGRVFIMYRTETNARKRTVIGQVSDNGKMHPNDAFKLLYPELWKQYYGEDAILPATITFGLFALFLAIAERCGLYNLLLKNFGAFSTNALMDQLMLLSIKQSNSEQQYEDCIMPRMSFSNAPLSASIRVEELWPSIKQEAIAQLKLDWIRQSSLSGCSEVWLCVGGTNSESSEDTSELSKFSLTRSRTVDSGVYYIWAVDAATGRSVSCYTVLERDIDTNDLILVRQMLAKASIYVKGIIAGDSICSEYIISLAEASQLDYMIKLNDMSDITQSFYEHHCSKIRGNVKFIVNEDGLFGDTAKAKILNNGTKENCIGFFFDEVVNSQNAADLVMNVLHCYKSTRAEIAIGNSSVSIPDSISNYLTIENVDGKTTVAIDKDKCQKDIDRKGFYTVVSAKDRDAAEIANIFSKYARFEKQFKILNSEISAQLAHNKPSLAIETTIAIALLNSIIMTEIQSYCDDNYVEMDETLHELDSCQAFLQPNGMYVFHDSLSGDVKNLFTQMDISSNLLKRIVEDYNKHSRNSAPYEIKRLPRIDADGKPKRGRPRKITLPSDEPAIRRKPGRPKGSKNKATLERDRLAAEAIGNSVHLETQIPPKRGPGRPKGSKNKATLER